MIGYGVIVDSSFDTDQQIYHTIYLLFGPCHKTGLDLALEIDKIQVIRYGVIVPSRNDADPQMQVNESYGTFQA